MSAPAADRPTSVNADGIFEPFPISRVPLEEFLRGERFGMRYRHLSSFGGGTQVSVSMEELPPGRQANQAHYHLLEEEHLYLIEGSLTLTLGDKRYLMAAGDYVCFPAGQKAGHAIFNHTEAPCRYLVLGTSNPHDVAVHTETGRVAVRLMGEGYRRSSVMGYWDEVDVDRKD
jgi:uncharacterized cupin superfamily protein